MRKFVMIASTAVALSLTACGGTSESYPVGVSDAWSKVESSGYAASSFGMPYGLAVTDVRAVFEPSPADRTGSWRFVHNGKELARLDVAVEGDQASSTVTYSYAAGDVSAADKTIEQVIRQVAQPLIVEAVDAAIENRPLNESMKKSADAQSTEQLIGRAVTETYSAIGKAKKESDERWAARDAEDAARAAEEAAANAQQSAGKPTTDLTQYN